MEIPAYVDPLTTTRRPRRSRRHSGWRARVAAWLRRVADIINPLEAP
jgi:hypothetical protein